MFTIQCYVSFQTVQAVSFGQNVKVEEAVKVDSQVEEEVNNVTVGSSSAVVVEAVPRLPSAQLATSIIQQQTTQMIDPQQQEEEEHVSN